MAPSYRKGRPLPWLAQVRDASGNRLTMAFASKEDALAYEAKERRKRQLTRAGLQRPQDAILFIDAVQKYLRKRSASGDVTHSSVSQDSGRFKNYWLEKFGKRPVATISTADLREHLDYIQFELNHSPADRNRHRALLHTFFQDLFVQELIPGNPVARIPLLSEKRRKKFGELKPEDQPAYVKAMYAEGADYGMLASLTCWTGGRVMACAAIQYRDVDFDAGVIHLCRLIERSSQTLQERTKGRGDAGEEAVPLLPVLREEILNHRRSSAYTRPSDFIVNRPGGGWMPYESYLDAHDRAVASLKVPRFTPHAVRSFFATAAKRAGFTRSERMEMLGHTSEAMTARYDRKDIQHLVDRAAKLGFGSTGTTRLRKRR